MTFPCTFIDILFDFYDSVVMCQTTAKYFTQWNLSDSIIFNHSTTKTIKFDNKIVDMSEKKIFAVSFNHIQQ